MIHHRHHLIRADEKSPHHVSNHDSIPHPELDLYRSTLTIDGNGSRELNRLGAKSRWRRSLLETKMEKQHAELAKEKLGWFDKEKQHVLEELKEQIVGLDRAKGDVLRELGVRTGEFFDAAVQSYPNARSFDVRIDRLDDGRIEAMLYVDEDRASRVSLEETAFEQAIERLKRELAAARVERERTIREEMENTDLREEGEGLEDKSGCWRT